MRFAKGCAIRRTTVFSQTKEREAISSPCSSTERSAERDAQRRDLLAFRTRNLYEYCGGPHIIVFSGRTPEELEQEISTILGTDYRLPSPIMHEGSLFPADATDEQMLAVSRLFDGPFFYVAELEFAAGANLPASEESPS